MDEAVIRWARGEDAYKTLEWTLVRDPKLGALVAPRTYSLTVAGAYSIGWPTVTALYVIGAQYVTIKSIRFRDADAKDHGNA